MPGKNTSKPKLTKGLKIQKEWLETLHQRYHRRELLGSDPLEWVYQYSQPEDQEIVAWLACSLAYGNVKAMRTAIKQVLQPLGKQPAAALMQNSQKKIHQWIQGFRYRVTDEKLMAGLLAGTAEVLREYGSLQACFLEYDDSVASNVIQGLQGLVDSIQTGAGGALPHLLARPQGGSACKRLMLFMKWMVRHDEIDPGGWAVDPSRLVMPIDTHIFQMTRQLGWTKKKTVNLQTALEITAVLKKICPEDPLKYDFAMTRPGILREDALDWPKPLK